MATSSPTSSCTACQAPFTLFHRRKVCSSAIGGCDHAFCSACLCYGVMTEEEAKKGAKGKVVTVCKACFKKHSALDFDAKEDIMGPPPGEAPTIVYVHGGGGNRFMFRQHAKEMVAKGLRCVLLDLPGHGSRMDEPLSMETAIQTIVDTIKAHAPPCRGIKPIYIGGSLGGYLGMEFLGQHPDLVSCAIILMAGQTVGVGRGLAARVGLVMLKNLMGAMSQATLCNGLAGEARKNGVSEEALQDIALRTGMFFQQGAAQVAILQATNPVEALQSFQGPVLYINGSKDHHDGQDKWLAATPNKAASKLIVYEGGDHFFSHNPKYSSRLVDDTWAFIEPLLAGPPSTSL